MKKKYVAPQMTIIEIEAERILAGSGERGRTMDVNDGAGNDDLWGE